MYQLYKDDLYGNKVPYMVATKPFADRLMRDLKHEITRVVDVPRNVQALIKLEERWGYFGFDYWRKARSRAGSHALKWLNNKR